MAYPGQWTLRHLILIFSDAEQVQAFLNQHHPRPSEVSELLRRRKQDPNEILTTVQSKLLPLAIVAARWDVTPEKRSLKDWVKRQEVMVLGSDHTYQDTLKLLNSLILNFLVAELNTQPSSRQRRTWLYIDEASAAGRFAQLERLVALGRSAGVCVVIAFQNVAGFMETYTENVAKSIMGLCRHWAIFGVDMMSAQWIAQQIGDYEELQTSISESSSVQIGPSGVSTSTSTSVQTQRRSRPTVLPQQLMDMNMPQAGPESGVLAGFFISPGKGIHYHRYAWDQVRRWQIDPVDEAECPAYLRVEDTDPSLSLRPLTPEERRLFGLSLKKR